MKKELRVKKYTAVEVIGENMFAELTPERGIEFLEETKTLEEKILMAEEGLKFNFKNYQHVHTESAEYDGMEFKILKGIIFYTIE